MGTPSLGELLDVIASVGRPNFLYEKVSVNGEKVHVRGECLNYSHLYFIGDQRNIMYSKQLFGGNS